MKETVKTRNAQIEASNKRFMKMSKERRRVAIARDVIIQLDMGKLKAENMIYFNSSSLNRLGNNTQLQSALLPPTASCNVCALGALFVCGVQKADKVTAGEAGVGSSGSVGGQAIKKYLRQFFSPSQLASIEATFEGWGSFSSNEHRFYDSVVDYDSDPSILMRLIMENVIANKGTFKPEILPEFGLSTPGYKG